MLANFTRQPTPHQYCPVSPGCLLPHPLEKRLRNISLLANSLPPNDLRHDLATGQKLLLKSLLHLYTHEHTSKVTGQIVL
jgi:hypothetical protein